MPILRPDSIFQEFLFTPEEDIASKILGELQVKKFNTKLAEVLKEKAYAELPGAGEADREYFNKQAFYAGQIALITEIFMDHANAIKSLAGQSPQANVNVSTEVRDLETRAAQQVHQPS